MPSSIVFANKLSLVGWIQPLILNHVPLELIKPYITRLSFKVCQYMFLFDSCNFKLITIVINHAFNFKYNPSIIGDYDVNVLKKFKTIIINYGDYSKKRLVSALF